MSERQSMEDDASTSNASTSNALPTQQTLTSLRSRMELFAKKAAVKGAEFSAAAREKGAEWTVKAREAAAKLQKKGATYTYICHRMLKRCNV